MEISKFERVAVGELLWARCRVGQEVVAQHGAAEDVLALVGPREVEVLQKHVAFVCGEVVLVEPEVPDGSHQELVDVLAHRLGLVLDVLPDEPVVGDAG